MSEQEMSASALNAGRALSLVKSMDMALAEIQSKLFLLEKLAGRAARDHCPQRSALQEEVDSLLRQIDLYSKELELLLQNI